MFICFSHIFLLTVNLFLIRGLENLSEETVLGLVLGSGSNCKFEDIFVISLILTYLQLQLDPKKEGFISKGMGFFIDVVIDNSQSSPFFANQIKLISIF